MGTGPEAAPASSEVTLSKHGQHIQWEHNLAAHPYNNTQAHAHFFAMRLEEEIGEYKQYSLRPGSGFHGVLRHPLDGSHTRHNAQEKHATLGQGEKKHRGHGS